MAELEGSVSAAAEAEAQLNRDKAELEATLSALQKALGAEDPKVGHVVAAANLTLRFTAVFAGEMFCLPQQLPHGGVGSQLT